MGCCKSTTASSNQYVERPEDGRNSRDEVSQEWKEKLSTQMRVSTVFGLVNKEDAEAEDKRELEKLENNGEAVEASAAPAEGAEQARQESKDSSAEAAAAAAAAIEEMVRRLDIRVSETREKVKGLLAVGSLFDAEKVLMEAITAISLEAACEERQQAFDALRHSEEYSQTLAKLIFFEERTKRVMEKADLTDKTWKVAAIIPVDYKALGMELTPEGDKALTKEDRFMNMYWRKIGDQAEVRMQCMIPTRLANIPPAESVLTAWVALNSETELFDQWHPIIAGKGPIELVPRGPYYNLWHTCTKIMMMKMVALQEQRMFFNSDSGGHLLLTDDLPEDAPEWKQFPPPKSFKLDPDCVKISTVTLPQENATFMSVHLEVDFKSPPPAWLLKMIMEWVLPEICRRLLKASIKTVKPGGLWRPDIENDRNGLYKVCREHADKAEELSRQRGHLYSTRDPPPVEMLYGRTQSLTNFETEGGKLVMRQNSKPAVPDENNLDATAEALTTSL